MEFSTEQLIQQAISEAKAGNKANAKKILSQVVKQEPQNARAWYLLSQVVDTKEQSIYCLNRALEVQPDNKQIQQRLLILNPPTTEIEKYSANEIATKQGASLRGSTKPIQDLESLALLRDRGIITEIEFQSKKEQLLQRIGRTDDLKNQYLNPTQKTGTISKEKKKQKKSLPLILIGLLLLCFICVVIPALNLDTDTGNKTNTVENNINPASDSVSFDETKAIKLVQDWKPKNIKGWTCKESFDAVVYFYRNNLGISDARVEWSASKQDDQNYIVFARLKGETGWANYSWKLSLPNMQISTSDSMTLCPTD